MKILFQRRPFVPVAILFACGIVTSRSGGLELWTGVLLICTAIALLLFRSIRWCAAALLIFSLGAALYSARYAILSENDLRLIIEEKPALVSIRGELFETPAVREFPGRTNNVEYSYARVQLSEILFERQWRPATGILATTTRGILDPEFFKGRRIELSGVIDRPKHAQAPGMFDFRQYLYNSRVFYQIRCESTNDWILTSFEPLPVTEWFQRWAHNQLARGLPARDEPLEMVRAMALGTNQSLTGEVADVFMRTGTMHIFAISGLHVACIAACILWVLRMTGVPRDRAALILIPLIWFYTVATGLQSSAVRSALMSTFVFAGWALRRPTELLNSLAGAAALILLFEPEQLFQASFQLSFAVVAAIALILDHSRDGESWPVRVQHKLLVYDPLLPPELRPKWKKTLEYPVGFVLGNLAISGASWIGSNPLTAYYFNMVTPISLVANLVAVPLSSISLAATLGSLLLPPLGPIFNYVSWATMWATIAVTRWLSHLSWGYFYVPKPNLWFFIAYFCIAALCVMPRLRAADARRYAYAFTAFSVLLWLCSLFPSSQSTVLTMLPTRGNPLMIDTPGRANDLLVDCSNERSAEMFLKRFLRGQGFGSLRNVLLTKGDSDHAAGFRLIQREFSPRAVFASTFRSRSRVYRDVLSQLEAVPGLLRKVCAGDRLPGWELLHPSCGTAFSRADDNAIVMRSEIHGWKVLLLSDLGPLARKSLLEQAAELRADILVCAATPELIDSELLSAVAPRVILVSGVESPYKRRRRDAPNPLRDSGAMVVSTSNEGAVTLQLSRTSCQVQTADGNWFALERVPGIIPK